MTIVNASTACLSSAGSSRPRRADTRIRCPVELMGRYSVTPFDQSQDCRLPPVHWSLCGPEAGKASERGSDASVGVDGGPHVDRPDPIRSSRMIRPASSMGSCAQAARCSREARAIRRPSRMNALGERAVPDLIEQSTHACTHAFVDRSAAPPRTAPNSAVLLIAFIIPARPRSYTRSATCFASWQHSRYASSGG